MYSIVILWQALHKEDIEKEWSKLEQNQLDLIQQNKDFLTKQELY